MGDVKSRLAAVRARRVRKNSWNYDASAFEALRRAEEFFGSKDKLGIARRWPRCFSQSPAVEEKGEQKRGTAKGIYN
jgi:hypothetical protein